MTTYHMSNLRYSPRGTGTQKTGSAETTNTRPPTTKATDDRLNLLSR